ncbi:MAG: ferritin family protein [Oligoflexia bacterium]|nr:ferritin family protein [Oligoflexia bacterium]
MDICKIAIEKENKMEHFYNQLYKESTHFGLKNIFFMMSNEEKKHANKFKQIIEDKNISKKISVLDSDITPLDMPKIKNILNEIKKIHDIQYISKTEQEIYLNICNLEKESEKFYLDMVSITDENKLKQLLRAFALEERNHYFLMCDIYEMVRAPTIWVENAEFNHMKEY